MAVQANTNLTTDFAKAQSIDFTNRFVDGIQKLQELLGITRRTAMANGSIIKVYKKTAFLSTKNTLQSQTASPESNSDTPISKIFSAFLSLNM